MSTITLIKFSKLLTVYPYLWGYARAYFSMVAFTYQQWVAVNTCLYATSLSSTLAIFSSFIAIDGEAIVFHTLHFMYKILFNMEVML